MNKKSIKYLILLTLIPFVSCHSNNNTNKKMDYFRSNDNAESYNIDLMIEESEINYTKK